VDRANKTFALILTLVIVLSCLTLLTVKPANAQTISTVTPAPPTTTQATATNGSLELTSTIPKTVYNLGEPVNATYILTNISNKTVNFYLLAQSFDLLVYNASNSLIYQYTNSGIAFPLVASYITLNPGESTDNRTVTWSQDIVMQILTPWQHNVQVPSGTYYLVGASWITNYTANSTISLQTNPIEIQIVGNTSTPSPTPISTAPTLSTTPSPTPSPTFSVPELTYCTFPIVVIFGITAVMALFLRKVGHPLRV
jgi:hypothetical protein